MQDHAVVGADVAEAVDRGHRGDDDGVVALQQRLGGRQPHLLDVLVDRGVLLYKGIARRHVGLGLVVVVVRHEILDRVLREEVAELRVQLRRERLVRRQHQRRALQLRDDVGDGERLARAGDAEQRLVGLAAAEPGHQRGNGFRLVAGGFKGTDEFERLAHGYVFHGASGILAHFATAFAENRLV